MEDILDSGRLPFHSLVSLDCAGADLRQDCLEGSWLCLKES
jgi:hypothetical protein